MTKKLIAALLALCLLAALAACGREPVSAPAAGTGALEPTTLGGAWTTEVTTEEETEEAEPTDEIPAEAAAITSKTTTATKPATTTKATTKATTTTKKPATTISAVAKNTAVIQQYMKELPFFDEYGADAAAAAANMLDRLGIGEIADVNVVAVEEDLRRTLAPFGLNLEIARVEFVDKNGKKIQTYMSSAGDIAGSLKDIVEKAAKRLGITIPNGILRLF